MTSDDLTKKQTNGGESDIIDVTQTTAYTCLDDEIDRPHRFRNGLGALSWTDEVRNITYYYHSNPLFYSCPFVLSQELCERLAYYGLAPTLKNFLKRVLHTTDSGASAYMGVFQGTMYVTPIISAAISDTFLGVFRTILVFSCFYLVGLGFMELASFQSIAEPWMVHVGLLVFLCAGAGGIKSCVNVFGAQQFHPIEQQKGITTFFTLFYASINVGSLVGGLSVPQLAESVSYSVAYIIPLVSFSLALIAFLLGSPRYVKQLPQGSPVIRCAKLLFETIKRRSLAMCRVSNGGPFEDEFVRAATALVRLMPLCALQIPFLVSYNQMQTAFLTQGEKMDVTIFGVSFAPALMLNIDPVAVIFTSLMVESVIFPRLRKRDALPSLLMRFFVGCILGALAMTSAFLVESTVMTSPMKSVSVWWQVPQFTLIAAGEVFMISTGYEAAFTFAPTELKTVSSALNLLNFAVSGYISGGLFMLCADWMPDFKAHDISTVTSAHYDYYFLVLASACVVGCLLCLAMQPYFKTMKPYQQTQAEDQKNGHETGKNGEGQVMNDSGSGGSVSVGGCAANGSNLADEGGALLLFHQHHNFHPENEDNENHHPQQQNGGTTSTRSSQRSSARKSARHNNNTTEME